MYTIIDTVLNCIDQMKDLARTKPVFKKAKNYIDEIVVFIRKIKRSFSKTIELIDK